MNRTFQIVLMASMLAACSHVPTRTESTLAADAETVGLAVADWQLRAFDDLSYLPTFVADSAYARGWIKSTFYIGLDRFASATNEAAMFATLQRLSRDNGFDLGRHGWHADDQAIVAVYANAAGRLGDTRLLSPTLREFDRILENRATHGLEFTPPPDGFPAEGGCQRRWCWADAIFMAPPSWAKIARVTGDDKYRQYAVEESKATIEYLFDPETHLFFRDSRFFDRKTSNGKKVFWSRGNGWVFAGLARFIEALPADHPERGYFVEVFRKMAAALIDLQRADGYWPTSLLDAGLYDNPETSGTGFFGFGLAWGLNEGIVSGPAYEDAVTNAWAAMTAAVDEDGKLGWVQQVGKSPEATTGDSSQIYGAGAFLLMAAELIRGKPAAVKSRPVSIRNSG